MHWHVNGPKLCLLNLSRLGFLFTLRMTGLLFFSLKAFPRFPRTHFFSLQFRIVYNEFIPPHYWKEMKRKKKWEKFLRTWGFVFQVFEKTKVDFCFPLLSVSIGVHRTVVWYINTVAFSSDHTSDTSYSPGLSTPTLSELPGEHAFCYFRCSWLVFLSALAERRHKVALVSVQGGGGAANKIEHSCAICSIKIEHFAQECNHCFPAMIDSWFITCESSTARGYITDVLANLSPLLVNTI